MPMAAETKVVIVPQYTISTHTLMCGGLTRVERDHGVKLKTGMGERWFCCEGCPLYEIFFRLDRGQIQVETR